MRIDAPDFRTQTASGPLLDLGPMIVAYQFADYGDRFAPAPGRLVLDVGLATVPGVIDHHHPEAEAECAASLIVKHPRLVLDHVRRDEPLTVITHRLPDFDALAAIFLALKLVETGGVDSAMAEIAAYARIVDSAALPKTIDLAATPYAVLRALFSGSKKSEDDINRERIDEGGRFMRLLHARAGEDRSILSDPKLFAGIDRYERAARKVEADYLQYLDDLERGRTFRLKLPTADGKDKVAVDGLAASNPRSFLLKEWARRDRDHPPLGAGFSFLMTRFGATRCILGVDPDRGVNLRGLGLLLNSREGEKRRSLGRPFPRPWYEGDCPFFDCRIIDSPRDGTLLEEDDILAAVLEFGSGDILNPN